MKEDIIKGLREEAEHICEGNINKEQIVVWVLLALALLLERDKGG